MDNDSDFGDLNGELDEYVQNKKYKCEGLIEGRMIGATHGLRELLVFLECNCEVNVMQLQPLLAVIQEDQQTMACPVIFIISVDALTNGSLSSMIQEGFSWGTHFKRDLALISELGRPEGAPASIKSPTRAGELFARNRCYCNELDSVTVAWISGKEKMWKYHLGSECVQVSSLLSIAL